MLTCFRGEAFKITPIKYTFPESLIIEEFNYRYVFSFFEQLRILEILHSEAIFTFCLYQVCLHASISYYRNVLNITNNLLHMGLQIGVSDFSKIALFSFYTILHM